MTILPPPSDAADSDLPESGQWPTIPVVGLGDSPPELVAEFVDDVCSNDELVDEVLAFYAASLVPQLACAPDGSMDPWPQRGWLCSSAGDRRLVLVRDVGGVLRGAWVLRDRGVDGASIYYPCATVDAIAAIFRALWDETIAHFDYVWGDTANPVIMAFAAKAVRVPPTPGSPTIDEEAGRLEWRRA